MGGRPEMIGLSVPDARHHLVVQGVTGCGKTTLLAQMALAEARAGRGVVVLDCQGDLSQILLDRLPLWCGDRLIVIDPVESQAPPAYNVLDPVGGRPEWAADTVAAVCRRVFHRAWGPRMDDLMRSACLTLAARHGSTLPDVLALLTDTAFRRQVLTRHTPHPMLARVWADYDQLTPPAQAQLSAPLVSRLRGVLSRQLARDLLGSPASTINLSEVLDGGILIARLPKGELGEDTPACSDRSSWPGSGPTPRGVPNAHPTSGPTPQ
jgi:hypothetical protein